jgi:hypothetical protein
MGESGVDGGDRGFNAKKSIGHLGVTHIDMTGDVVVSADGTGMASTADLSDMEDITENAGDFLDDVEEIARPVVPPRSSTSKGKEKKKSRRSTSVDPPESLTPPEQGDADLSAQLIRSASLAGAA